MRKKNYCTFHRSGRRGFAFNRPDGKSTEYLVIMSDDVGMTTSARIAMGLWGILHAEY